MHGPAQSCCAGILSRKKQRDGLCAEGHELNVKACLLYKTPTAFDCSGGQVCEFVISDFSPNRKTFDGFEVRLTIYLSIRGK